MEFSGYDDENTTLTDRSLRWKTYHDHALYKIRQLRGRINIGMKKAYFYLLCSFITITFIYYPGLTTCKISVKVPKHALKSEMGKVFWMNL